MSNSTPFIFQLTEAISALSIPIGGGLAAYAKWRKNAERDRRAREEAARIASERAAADVRKEAQTMLEKLLAEKDATIARLTGELSAEREESKQLHAMIEGLLKKEG